MICDSKVNWYRIFNKKTNNCIKFKTELLANKEIKEKFQEEIRKNSELNENKIEWTNIAQTLKTSAENVLGQKERKHQEQTSNKIKTLSEKQKQLRISGEISQDPTKRKELKKKIEIKSKKN